MGIGMKVPFTISDQYTLISRWNGTEYSFSAFKDEDDSAQLILLSERLTNECNGFEVRVPVEAHNFSKCIEKLPKALMFFNPKPECNIPIEWEDVSYSFEGDTWGLQTGSDYGQRNCSKVIMGNLWYPIESNQIRENYNDKYARVIERGIDIHLPIGSIPLPLSREALIYNEKSIQLIRDTLDTIIEVLISNFQTLLSNQPNLYQAMEKYSENRRLMDDLNPNNQDYTYDNYVLNTRINVPCPAEKVTRIGKYRWRYKSINLREYTDESITMTNGNTVPPMLPVNYSSHESIVMMIKEGTKKVPSRTINFMKDNHPTADIELWWYTDATEQKVLDWLCTIYGYLTVDKFDDVVPDYKVQRSASASTRKVASALVLSEREAWDDYMWWNDSPDIDLNNTRGIWVDVRSRRLVSTHHCRDEKTLFRVHNALVNHDIIPEGTRVYGCPGSHKNLMKDHPNFMHIDDAIKLAFSVVEEGTTLIEKSKFNYVASCNEFYSTERKLLGLDIDVDMSYYNVIKKRVKQHKELYSNNIYETYQGCRYIIDRVFNQDDLKGIYNYYESKEEELDKKFFLRYPLLNGVSVDHSAEMVNHVEDYIKLKEFCNV